MRRNLAIAATTLVAGLAAAAPAGASTPLPVVGQQFTYSGITCTVDTVTSTATGATGTGTCVTRFGTFHVAATYDAATGKVAYTTVKL